MSAQLVPLWLASPDRFNVAARLDIQTGRVLERVKLRGPVGRTAGFGKRCGRRFVALYSTGLGSPSTLTLQIGSERLTLDRSAAASQRTRLAGLVSTLIVTGGDGIRLSARECLPIAVGMAILDSAYDELDRLEDDFLAYVAAVAGSRAAQQALIHYLAPGAAPGELVPAPSALQEVRLTAHLDGGEAEAG